MENEHGFAIDRLARRNRRRHGAFMAATAAAGAQQAAAGVVHQPGQPRTEGTPRIVTFGGSHELHQRLLGCVVGLGGTAQQPAGLGVGHLASRGEGAKLLLSAREAAQRLSLPPAVSR